MIGRCNFSISNFRIAVHIDFATGQVRPLGTGTHAEYDRAKCGYQAVVKAKLQDTCNRIMETSQWH
jgi:hypothetical protein